MPTMDLNTFYHHALQWKHQQEEAERLAAEEMAESIRNQWKQVADLIREMLPIQGMTIYETETGQFNAFPVPGRLIDLDCCIDPNVRDTVARSQGELTKGVIRVRVFWDKEDTEQSWKILKYVVWVDDKSTEFDNPYSAFLAAFHTLSENTMQKD